MAGHQKSSVTLERIRELHRGFALKNETQSQPRPSRRRSASAIRAAMRAAAAALSNFSTRLWALAGWSRMRGRGVAGRAVK